MGTKHTRDNSGFTILELTITIALIAIVAAIAFAASAQYFRGAYQHEMDETAKTIYIAAQNHLTVADSLGVLSGKSDNQKGRQDETTEEGQAENSGIYYYVVPADKAKLNDATSMLATMLPEMSIDETVRTNGSYIIRYQYNGFTATVLDVFYANPSGGLMQSSFSYAFETSDFATLFGNEKYRDTGIDGQNARANYKDKGIVIGYYGGAGAAGGVDSLPVPRLEIYNNEELSAIVSNSDLFDSTVRFEFYATGEVSTAVSEPISTSKARSIRNSNLNNGQRFVSVIFDSVTKESTHFADIKSSVLGKEFIPGENITIQVFAIDTTSTKVSKSTKHSVNSLFDSMSTTSNEEVLESFEDNGFSGSLGAQDLNDSTPSGSYVFKISNIRHLENLSNLVSSYDSSALATKIKDREHLSTDVQFTYEQTVDLSWSDFCKAVAGLKPVGGVMPSDTADSLAVQIYPKQGSASKAHTFLPISWTAGDLVYKGNGHKVVGIEIDGSGNAGLFGTMTGSTSGTSSISDLELLNFKVATKNGHAGTLAGQATRMNITRIFAHDETDDSSLGISQTGTTGAVGGLVGRMEAGTMTGCAAVEYVSGVNVAGGLIGQATDRATVQYSYSGGHTSEGAYEGGRYATNVTATLTAGGLIGSFTSGTLTGCYSTCSVAAGTTGTANRFVGSNGATTTNCYAVGAVNGEGWMKTGVDGNTLTTGQYDALIGGGKNAAHPFDTTLDTAYAGKYPFKSIAEISGAANALGLSAATETQVVKHLNEHYGDWPPVVTLVVNS